MIAANVNGMPILKKSEFLTVYPSLRRIPIPVMFAEAPIGVQFPPSVAPERSPNYSTVGSTFNADASPAITGIIVAT